MNKFAAIAGFALVTASSVGAQYAPAEVSFAAYQRCFDQAATELIASGVKKAAKLEKAARKRCKAERDQAVIDAHVQFLLNQRLTPNLTYPDMVRALDRTAAAPTMQRLGFERY